MPIAISGTVDAVTEKAIHLKEYDVWIPKSQILECDVEVDEIEEGMRIDADIPTWLAIDKELG